MAETTKKNSTTKTRQNMTTDGWKGIEFSDFIDERLAEMVWQLEQRIIDLEQEVNQFQGEAE